MRHNNSGLTENGKEWEITSLVPIASTCSNCTIYTYVVSRAHTKPPDTRVKSFGRKVVQRTNNDSSNKIVEDKNKKKKTENKPHIVAAMKFSSAVHTQFRSELVRKMLSLANRSCSLPKPTTKSNVKHLYLYN